MVEKLTTQASITVWAAKFETPVANCYFVFLPMLPKKKKNYVLLPSPQPIQ
jgi:hypothetical protein